ncbi:MAG: flavodoxin family protein [Actinobacteria bacterium]|nr:MAG: flavodoxin family protein [Actinomycetota bacterium]
MKSCGKGPVVNSLIVYDSVFGHTEYLASVIASQLVRAGKSNIVHVQGAGLALLHGVDLLIVGSPTHKHKATSTVQEWLARLPREASKELPAAAFDTRYGISRLKSGSAARPIARRLRRKGCRLVVPPESFFVESREGPLENGEAERAREWAATILRRMGPST